MAVGERQPLLDEKFVLIDSTAPGNKTESDIKARIEQWRDRRRTRTLSCLLTCILCFALIIGSFATFAWWSGKIKIFESPLSSKENQNPLSGVYSTANAPTSGEGETRGCDTSIAPLRGVLQPLENVVTDEPLSNSPNKVNKNLITGVNSTASTATRKDRDALPTPAHRELQPLFLNLKRIIKDENYYADDEDSEDEGGVVILVRRMHEGISPPPNTPVCVFFKQ